MKHFSKLYVIERAPGSKRDGVPGWLIVLGVIVVVGTFLMGMVG